MRILALGTERKLFEEGSEARSRIAGYGEGVDELHIVVYTPSGFEEQQIADNVFVHPTNSKIKPLYFFDAYRIGARLLNKSFVITSQEGMTNIAAILLKLRFRVPLEVQVHTDIENPHFKRESFKNRMRYIGYRLGFVFADCIRVVSTRIKNSLTAGLGIPKEKIHILPILVDIDGIRNVFSTFDLHEKHKTFDFIAVVVSRLTREKNVSLAILALKDVIEKHPNTGLVVVGEGPAKESLLKQVKKEGIEGNVVFEPWTPDVISYYKTADAYILTSNYEGYARTLVEAAASDCPIVTTDVGIAGDILKDRTGALICPVGDVACIASKITELIENPKLRSLLRLNAQKEIQMVRSGRSAYLKEMTDIWKKCAERK